ncbi:MAG: dihydropyrimidinase [Chlorobi bacterium]|nr:dihydropyrimidinase [Chlorobiota bacterium]
MSVLIKNGKIVSSEKIFSGDILVSEGKIVKIANNIAIPDNCEFIDAEGQYIFPGGIDPHVHMHLPTFAGYSSDNFYTGSKAALYGGTTTLIDFVTPRKGQSLPDALAERKKEAENCLTDYTFHVSPISWHKGLKDEIKECVNQGVTSFKVYTAYKKSIGLDDNELFKVMQDIAEIGALLTVHAELGDDIEDLRNRFFEEGKISPKYHALSRPPETEYKAVKKIIEFAKKTNCKVYFVHISTGKSAEIIQNAQIRDLQIFAETCPQYLMINDEKLIGKFYNTVKFVFSPPPRKEQDNEKLWNALFENVILTVGTDHCPFTFEQKLLGKNDFRKIPNGAGGVEHRMSLLYTYGVFQNKISLNDFVKITSTNAAKIFGLYPQKGEIAVGSDADLIIWNEKNDVISAKTNHQNCDLNIYEGIKISGKPEIVIKAGKIVLSENKLSQKISSGRYLSRTL